MASIGKQFPVSRLVSVVAIALTCWWTTSIQAASDRAPAVDRDTVVVAINKAIENLDVHMAGSGDASRTAFQLYDALYTFDLTGRLIPNLATAHRVSPDGLTWRFTLRPGVRFHNGDRMTSADVKFSMERILNPETRSSRRPALAPVIDKVETPDAQTVVFHLKQPDGAFLNKMAGYLYVVPEKYTKGLAKLEDFSRAPVGSGPWKFVENRVGETVTLERFDGYWGPKPKAERLILRVIDEPSTRLNALITGEVDLADGIPPTDVEKLRQNTAFDVMVNPVSSPLHIRLYSNRPELPVSKLEVRQALNYAIDQNAIIKNVLYGLGEPLATYFSKHYPVGGDPTLKPYPYDPDKARALLKAAGYPNGFSTKLYSPVGWPKELAEVIAGYWSQIGVQAEIQRLDYAAWTRLNNTHKSDPMTLTPFSNAIFDLSSTLQGAVLKTGNWSDYYNPKVEELAAKVLPISDPVQRGKLFKEIGKILHDDAAAIYITEEVTVFAKKKGLKWGALRGSVNLNFRDIGWN